MKQKLKLLLVLIFFASCEVYVQAQEAVSTSGGNSKGSGGSVSYTIGQVFYRTLQASEGSAAEGVQQPYEISIVTAIENTEWINLKYKVYPNPTVGVLNLIIQPYENKKMLYQLYDHNGSLLLVGNIKGEKTEVSLEKYSSSIYFLKVIVDNTEFKVFKIVKR